ncbi:hypothetical protein BDF19DRAFT_439630, partial [Syncephalis fuscata]
MTLLPPQAHLHPRRWVAPLAAFTMAIMLGVYVRSSIKQHVVNVIVYVNIHMKKEFRTILLPSLVDNPL